MDSFPALSQHNSCPNGYKETYGTVVKKWLISEMKYGFFQRYGTIVTDTSKLTDSVIFKNVVRSPTYDMVLKWKIDYKNLSTIPSNISKIGRHVV